jgi:hypothetical protein
MALASTISRDQAYSGPQTVVLARIVVAFRGGGEAAVPAAAPTAFFSVAPGVGRLRHQRDHLAVPSPECGELASDGVTGQDRAYLYRAIDERGQMVDVMLRTHRDLDSARAFFVLAVYRSRAAPEEIITDKYPAYLRAIREEVLRGDAHPERAPSDARAGHVGDRAVPRPDEGSAAPDARGTVDPRRPARDQGGRAGANAAPGPCDRAGRRARRQGRTTRATAGRRGDLHLAR